VVELVPAVVVEHDVVVVILEEWLLLRAGRANGPCSKP